MRNILLLWCMFAPFLFSCVSLSESDIAIDYGEQRLITKEGASVNELYILTHEFLLFHISDAEVNVEFFDKEDGKIIGNYNVKIVNDSVYTDSVVYYNYTYNIDIRDGKIHASIKGIARRVDATLIQFCTDFLDALEEYIHNHSIIDRFV